MEYSLKDRTILRIALITTIIGLTSLCTIMFFKTEELISIIDIDSHKDQRISLQGQMINISHKNNNTRFILLQECGIEVIAFNEYINASKVIVTGKFQEYNGKKSIIADKIMSVR